MAESDLNHCTTTFHRFSQSCPDGPPLLAVCEGVPSIVALEEVSRYLALAMSLVGEVAVEHESSSSYAARQMIEVSKAILDSVVRALYRDGEVGVSREFVK